jgi:hypothetical protein
LQAIIKRQGFADKKKSKRSRDGILSIHHHARRDLGKDGTRLEFMRQAREALISKAVSPGPAKAGWRKRRSAELGSHEPLAF